MDLRDRLQATLGDVYTVERELGGGGMSRVFLAHETSLGRNVVVKVLGGELLAGLSAERFAREVRLAASLQHPNIVPVLTTGVADGIPYYTMPYVRGESLRARMKQTPQLSRRQSLSVLRDLARALQYAHGEGVIHRDIKPENILLSGDVAVVSDFGIAKAISAARKSDAGDVESQDANTLTQTGSSVGTPSYMAPEQAVGDKLDHRVDIYAWGLVAYELFVGEHPFAGKTSAAQMVAAHLSQIPVPPRDRAPNIPPALSDLVMACLKKIPDERPASAAQLLEDLETIHDSGSTATATRPIVRKVTPRRRKYAVIGLAFVVVVALIAFAYFAKSRTPAETSRSSVAVLPFADDRPDSANAYFGEGIADELMSALGKVPGLRVASRTSAIALGRRRDLDVRQIAGRLGVATVVEGTVRRADGHLRVTAQLTNAADGLTLWSDVYERESKDVFAVQDDITHAIVAALRPEFASATVSSAQKRAMGPGTTNPEAYDLYLRGLYLIERRGPGIARSVEYFNEAIKRDPNFARAYAGLADALEFFPYFAGVPSERVEARVKAAAQRSLQLDSGLAEPRVALAMANWHALRWRDAEAEFKAALSADSTSAPAHTQYGRFLLSIGRPADALREFRAARTLDPLAPTASVWLSHTLLLMGNDSAAREEARRARDLDPTLLTTRSILAIDLFNQGRIDEARTFAGAGDSPIPFNGMEAYLFEKTGDKARALAIRQSLDATPDTTWMVHYARAFAYLGMNDTAKVLSELEAGVARREFVPQWSPIMDPTMNPVRKSARFAAVTRSVGLTPDGTLR
ncbi:MAG: protein kinase [Gemmatimonadaceae bacterium]